MIDPIILCGGCYKGYSCSNRGTRDVRVYALFGNAWRMVLSNDAITGDIFLSYVHRQTGDRVVGDKTSANFEEKLPAPTESADWISKWVPAISLAVAGIWFPPASIAAAILPLVMERYVKKPRQLLIEELQRGNFRALSSERAAPLIPMAYRFFEAAKRG